MERTPFKLKSFLMIKESISKNSFFTAQKTATGDPEASGRFFANKKYLKIN